MTTVLKKSTQGHKTLQAAQAIHQYHDKNSNSDRKKAWFIFALFISPSLILMIALFFIHKKQVEQSQAMPEVVMDTISLPYLDLASLQDLPEPAPREVVIVPGSGGTKEDAFNAYATSITGQNNSAPVSSAPSSNNINNSNSSSNATSVPSANREPGFDNIDLSGVSPDIAQIFQDALNETKAPQTNPTASDFQHPVVNLVGNEQQFSRRLPAMNLETHIYSANKASWVKINGKDIKENELVPNSNVRVEQILPGSLIVQFEGQYIQIPALYEWKG